MQEEEEARTPSGYTNKLLGSPVQRVDRQSSIFGNGKGFTPMNASMGHPGRIQVVGGVFARQPFLGQLPPSSRSSPQVSHPQMAQPKPQPQKGSAAQVQDGTEEKPGRRLAWGRMKKLEAQELSMYLAEIADCMRKAGIPAGILAQIKDKLDTFVKTAPPAGEVEISETETQALNEAIFELEVAEQQAGSGITTSTVLVVAGVGLLAAILFS